MKKNICPKCSSKKIVIIPEDRTSNFIYTGKTNLQIVRTTLYICSECGYTEYYVRDKKQLEKICNKFS